MVTSYQAVTLKKLKSKEWFLAVYILDFAYLVT